MELVRSKGGQYDNGKGGLDAIVLVRQYCADIGASLVITRYSKASKQRSHNDHLSKARMNW
jgi:hypothetical protein